MVAVNLMGLSFDDLSVVEAVAALLARHPSAPFAYVVTPNVDHLARLARRPELLPLYQNAWLRLLDSHVIYNLARLLRLPVPQVSSGTDVTALLLSTLLAEEIAIIGYRQADLPSLQARCPHANFILHEPPMNLLNDPTAFAVARDFAVVTKARFTLIALGSPLQEMLAHAIASQQEATGVGLCIGAALEFCSGVRPRAPAWMQRAGLEWLHRLINDPTRLARRYLIDDPPLLLSMAGSAWRRIWREVIPARATNVLDRRMDQDQAKSL